MKVNQSTAQIEIPVSCPKPSQEGPIVLIHDSVQHRLAILLTTRGTLFSLAIESILREAVNLRGWTVAIFFTHDKNIPDGVNSLVERALAWGAEMTWLVEEDNYMPPGVLKALLNTECDVAACDYFNHQGTDWELTGQLGPIPFYAFGCTLVAAKVWRALGQPYCDISQIPSYVDGQIQFQKGKSYGYGGQDVDFCLKIWLHDFTSTRLSHRVWRCGHLHVERRGELKTNEGCHVVKIQ